MIDLSPPPAAGHHCLHPSFSLSPSLIHCLHTLLFKGPSHFALPACYHSCTPLPLCLWGRQGAAFTAHNANHGWSQENYNHNSTKTCLQSISQFVSVLSCAATSPQFPGSSVASQLEPSRFLLLGDRWHKGAAAFRGEVKLSGESRSGQRARNSPQLSPGTVSSPCCRGYSSKCQKSHKYIGLTNVPCGVGS